MNDGIGVPIYFTNPELGRLHRNASRASGEAAILLTEATCHIAAQFFAGTGVILIHRLGSFRGSEIVQNYTMAISVS